MNERNLGPRAAARVFGLRRCMALCGAVLALGLPLRAAADASCKLKSWEMPVTMVGSRAVVSLGINGTRVPMMVDSGAFFSMLTDAAAAQLGLPVRHTPPGFRMEGIAGVIDTRMTTVKQLKLIAGEIPDVQFIVGGNEMGGGAMGLIGRNLLSFTDVEYDLAHGAIRFIFAQGECGPTDLAYWARGTPVTDIELQRDGRSKLPALIGLAKLNGREISVMFDSGANSVVSLDAAHHAGVDDKDMKPAGRLYGAGRGEAKAWTAPIAKFELGGETIENNRLAIADFEIRDVDMLLGIDFFLSHRIYVSASKRHLFITYNGGPVFALNTAVPGVVAVGAGANPATPASAPAVAAVSDVSAVSAVEGETDEPADASGYARRGAASAARHDFVHALADLDRACELDPHAADDFKRRGLVRLALKQPAQARQDFDTALQLDPADAESRLARAWLRPPAEREGTLADLRSLDATLASQANDRLAVARLYMKLMLPAQALPQWNQWIAAHPNDVHLDTVRNDRCWTRTMLGVDLDQALDDCDAAVDAQSANPAFLDSRAWVRMRRGELRQALKDYERSLAIQPKGPWTLYGRGIARIRSGDAALGQADMDAARKLLPTIDVLAVRFGLVAAGAAAPEGAVPPTADAGHP